MSSGLPAPSAGCNQRRQRDLHRVDQRTGGTRVRLSLAGRLRGAAVTTVEGFFEFARRVKFHVQQEGAFADAGAVQCGFSRMAGQSSSAAHGAAEPRNPLCQRTRKPGEGLGGNLCRCSVMSKLLRRCATPPSPPAAKRTPPTRAPSYLRQVFRLATFSHPRP